MNSVVGVVKRRVRLANPKNDRRILDAFSAGFVNMMPHVSVQVCLRTGVITDCVVKIDAHDYNMTFFIFLKRYKVVTLLLIYYSFFPKKQVFYFCFRKKRGE